MSDEAYYNDFNKINGIKEKDNLDMGKKMTEAQKHAMQIVYEKEKDNVSDADYEKLYYGNDKDALFNGNDILKTINRRAIPSGIGMFAELALNPDLTLEELADTTSPKAIESKKAAGEYIKKMFGPDKEFNIEEFNRFHEKAMINWVDKFKNKLQTLEDDYITRKNFYDKVSVMIDGVWDLVVQKMVNANWNKTGLNEDLLNKNMVKAQTINTVFNFNTMNVESELDKYLEDNSEEALTQAVSFYNKFASFGLFESIKVCANKVFGINGYENDRITTPVELSLEYGQISFSKGKLLGGMYTNGILSKLDDFDMALLIKDNQLFSKIKMTQDEDEIKMTFDGMDMMVNKPSKNVSNSDVLLFRKKLYSLLEPEKFEKLNVATDGFLSEFMENVDEKIEIMNEFGIADVYIEEAKVADKKIISKLDNQAMKDLSGWLSEELNELDARTSFGRSSGEYRAMVKGVSKLKDIVNKTDMKKDGSVNTVREELEKAIKSTSEYLCHKGVGDTPTPGEKFKNDYERSRVEQARHLKRVLKENYRALINKVENNKIDAENKKYKKIAENINKLMQKVQKYFDKHANARKLHENSVNYIDSENKSLDAGKTLVSLTAQQGELSEEQVQKK